MSLRQETLSDIELMAASREGNEEAFRQIFDKYWKDLYKIAIKRVATTEDVKDILQEVFVSLWNNIQSVRINESLGGYLYISLRNKILNFYQKQNTLKALASQQFIAAETENLAWMNLQSRELQQFISQQLSQMPPQMKNIYLLSREQQLTNAEIAALMGLAPQTVKNQLYRALQKIREGLRSADLQLIIFLMLADFYSKK